MKIGVLLSFVCSIVLTMVPRTNANCTCESRFYLREVPIHVESEDAVRDVPMMVSIGECVTKLDRPIRPDSQGLRHASLQACCCKAMWKYRTRDGVAALRRCVPVPCTVL